MAKKKEKDDLVVKIDAGPQNYRKNNQLIEASYGGDININKMLAMALYCIEKGTAVYNEQKGTLECRWKAKELAKLMGMEKTSGRFYTKLDETADKLMNMSIYASNEKEQEFEYINFVGKCSYKNGEMVINFTEYATPLILDVKKNYTKFDLRLMLQYKNQYAFRLYELVRKKSYYNSTDDREHHPKIFEVVKSVNELKFLLGVYPTRILDKFKRGNDTDYDAAAEKAEADMDNYGYKTWGNFKAKVLDKAIKEINEISEMNVSLETIRSGRGGKITRVRFICEYKEDAKRREMLEHENDNVTIAEDGTEVVHPAEKKENSGDSGARSESISFTPEEASIYVNMTKRFKSITRRELLPKDARAVGDAAKWDATKIDKALDALESANNVENAIGFLIRAIENDYEPAVSKRGSTKNSFTNFKQRDNDYAELQRQLLKKGMESRSAKDKEDVEALKKNLAGRDPDKPFG